MSNIDKFERFQANVLEQIVYAPRFVSNETSIQTDNFNKEAVALKSLLHHLRGIVKKTSFARLANLRKTLFRRKHFFSLWAAVPLHIDVPLFVRVAESLKQVQRQPIRVYHYTLTKLECRRYSTIIWD